MLITNISILLLFFVFFHILFDFITNRATTYLLVFKIDLLKDFLFGKIKFINLIKLLFIIDKTYALVIIINLYEIITKEELEKEPIIELKKKITQTHPTFFV